MNQHDDQKDIDEQILFVRRQMEDVRRRQQSSHNKENVEAAPVTTIDCNIINDYLSQMDEGYLLISNQRYQLKEISLLDGKLILPMPSGYFELISDEPTLKRYFNQEDVVNLIIGCEQTAGKFDPEKVRHTTIKAFKQSRINIEWLEDGLFANPVTPIYYSFFTNKISIGIAFNYVIYYAINGVRITVNYNGDSAQIDQWKNIAAAIMRRIKINEVEYEKK